MGIIESTLMANSIPQLKDIEVLSANELKEIMQVFDSSDERGMIEKRIREIFLWAALKKASDIHIVGKNDRKNPDVHICVRTSSGLLYEDYRGESGRVFEDKLFQLGSIPQGGSTPAIVSSRFRMNIPIAYAKRYGLASNEGQRHYVVNVRLEYAKTYDGFSFVCRLLDVQKVPKFYDLGLPFTLLKVLETAIEAPSGLFLVSGPTGSGKSTLLNAMMCHLNDGTRTIRTVEDPVEYGLGVGPVVQIQVGGEITFPKALRSILRQDPDIILVGEIRDFETLKIAIEASQTGHLVLATIHSNSAEETMQRMITMFVNEGERGEEVLADNVRFIVSQRLLTMYEGENVPRDLTKNEMDWLINNGLPLFNNFSEVVPKVDADGKPIVKGWMPVIEGIAITDNIKIMVRNGEANPDMIYKEARNQIQYETLAEAGFRGVEANGCLLRDCIKSLHSNSQAKEFNSLRVAQALKYGLTLGEVGDRIDRRLREVYSSNAIVNVEDFDAVFSGI